MVVGGRGGIRFVSRIFPDYEKHIFENIVSAIVLMSQENLASLGLQCAVTYRHYLQ